MTKKTSSKKTAPKKTAAKKTAAKVTASKKTASKKTAADKDVIPDRAKQRQREAFARWYAKKKKAFNAERRQRYWEDEEHRQKAIEAARDYRERLAENRPPPSREYKGQQVQVFTVTELGEHVGRSADTLRAWEAKGLLPKPLFTEHSRLYTEHQLTLVDQLVRRLEMAADREERAVIEEIWAKRLADHWEEV